jgi:hypothetical protein
VSWSRPSGVQCPRESRPGALGDFFPAPVAPGQDGHRQASGCAVSAADHGCHACSVSPGGQALRGRWAAEPAGGKHRGPFGEKKRSSIPDGPEGFSPGSAWCATRADPWSPLGAGRAATPGRTPSRPWPISGVPWPHPLETGADDLLADEEQKRPANLVKRNRSRMAMRITARGRDRRPRRWRSQPPRPSRGEAPAALRPSWPSRHSAPRQGARRRNHRHPKVIPDGRRKPSSCTSEPGRFSRAFSPSSRQADQPHPRACRRAACRSRPDTPSLCGHEWLPAASTKHDNGGSRVLAVTSDRDTGLQMLEGTTNPIADSARVAITLDASCSACRMSGSALRLQNGWRTWLRHERALRVWRGCMVQPVA